jgi:hypothetical protein
MILRARAPRAPRRAFTPLGREGIALPMALLGLVAVTLLITTLLLTSGSEFAVSAAQRDASKSLYTADGALQQYVATQSQQAASSTRFVEGTSTFTYRSTDYTITSARLARRQTDTDSTTDATDTWSLIAAPKSPAHGRGVGALLKVSRHLRKMTLHVNAGATSGGNIVVGGSSTISNGRTGQIGCSRTDTANASVEVTSGSKITVNGNPTLQGKGDTSTVRQDTLMSYVLGHNMTLDSLAKYATIKFGPKFNQPAWPNNQAHSPNQTWSLTTSDSVYNWGCPAADLAGSNVTCTTAESQRFVIVAIDATGLGSQGGLTNAVTLNGDYGQGMLIILNGSLNIQGNFIFRGIVLVDKDLSMGGGSGQFTGKVEGTVVAFGDQSSVADNVNGKATIRYNMCSIVDAQNALNKGRIDDTPQVLNSSTFAWYELVR